MNESDLDLARRYENAGDILAAYEARTGASYHDMGKGEALALVRKHPQAFRIPGLLSVLDRHGVCQEAAAIWILAGRP